MWKEVGTATVDDNGNIVSDDGTGIENTERIGHYTIAQHKYCH